MVHLGIDIDQFILLTIYPAAVFFAIGYIAKKTKMRSVVSYLLNGGAQGLVVVLAMFGAVLLLMARKQKIQQQEEQSI
jgi:vacuolar-type H+-ATPase subunit I/STV1